ncbi:hypothetical protein TRV_00893 [Trichophyton verrucosum HKI 0517]|uniref:Uncharacterized protein n=1 Tax=Trichophyton verrucosum (strain HKI 0517) TaxID=663202 RepID=D4D1E3_TRIVH|nr:uncharacterized protein TRV_00893 [Trichophyton verrucosum HKI 0517]EFE44361.1 hypothetical protein TRV_00893 [Trichophyton verrucosum HKI 0517]
MQTADQLFAFFLASLLPLVTRFLINIDCKVEDLVFASSIVLVPTDATRIDIEKPQGEITYVISTDNEMLKDHHHSSCIFLAYSAVFVIS